MHPSCIFSKFLLQLGGYVTRNTKNTKQYLNLFNIIVNINRWHFIICTQLRTCVDSTATIACSRLYSLCFDIYYSLIINIIFYYLLIISGVFYYLLIVCIIFYFLLLILLLFFNTKKHVRFCIARSWQHQVWQILISGKEQLRWQRRNMKHRHLLLYSNLNLKFLLPLNLTMFLRQKTRQVGVKYQSN